MIPDYQSIMLPLLKLTSDKKEHKINDIIEQLAEQFKLTDEERKELLPSGQTFIFGNRVAWARTYLKKAGLLDSPKRGIVLITKRGLDILKSNPKEINVSTLKQFPEFLEFQSIKKEENGSADQVEVTSQVTPEESLELAYQQLRKTLAQDLINRIISLSPAFFEKLVVELLVKMGYGGSIKDADLHNSQVAIV